MDFFDKFDRQKLQRITLIVIAALTLLALVLLLVIIIASVGNDPSGIGPGGDLGDLFDSNKIDFTDTAVTAEQLSHGSLLLANASHPYSAPANANFVNIAQYRNDNGHSQDNFLYSIGDINNFKLEAEAMEYAHNMLTDLRNETNNDCIMISGAYGKDDSSKDLHTGYTMVLTVTGAAEPYLADESNKVLNDWLLANAHKYGFVVRYPADKTDATGVSDYTYAFRYVGIPHAHYMQANNLCLEEYVELLKKDYDSQKKLLTIKVDDKEYGVYYQSCRADDSIKVPENIPNPDGTSAYPYTLSGTNDGGVVVTVQVN